MSYCFAFPGIEIFHCWLKDIYRDQHTQGMEEELDICSHGSRMGREEKLLLRIVIAETNDPSSIFPNSTNYFVPSYLKHLELDKFGLSQISEVSIK